MQWIKSVDQLPEDDQNVLVWNENVPMLYMVCYYDKDWDEFVSLAYGINIPVSVTHWMPQPAPSAMEND